MIKELQRWEPCSSAVLRSVDWQLVTDVSGQSIGLIFKDQPGLLELWRVCYPETSVTNYKSTLRNTPEERSCRLHRDRSPMSTATLLWKEHSVNRETSHVVTEVDIFALCWSISLETVCCLKKKYIQNLYCLSQRDENIPSNTTL